MTNHKQGVGERSEPHSLYIIAIDIDKILYYYRAYKLYLEITSEYNDPYQLNTLCYLRLLNKQGIQSYG